jgi:hypothetical protein
MMMAHRGKDCLNAIADMVGRYPGAKANFGFLAAAIKSRRLGLMAYGGSSFSRRHNHAVVRIKMRRDRHVRF